MRPASALGSTLRRRLAKPSCAAAMVATLFAATPAVAAAAASAPVRFAATPRLATAAGTAAATPASAASTYAPVLPAAPPIPPQLGAPTAPVTVTEWADFQCPHCAAFARDTQPVLEREFIATGVARLQWRDSANRGPESVAAAIAARAAARQGAFWAYHDYLFAHQYGENSGSWDRAFLIGAAAGLGLDVPRFAVDLDDPALRDAVLADSAEARLEAPAGTPTFIVNGQVVAGALPVAVFEAAVRGALAAAGPSLVPAHPVTRLEHRPVRSAAARHPHRTPPHGSGAPHRPAGPTRAPDAPRTSRA